MNNKQTPIDIIKASSQIAHDIRNPIQAILLQAEEIKDFVLKEKNINTKETKKNIQKFCETVIKDATRVISVTDTYLQYSHLKSKNNPPKKTLVDINPCILDEINRIKTKDLTKNIIIMENLSKNLPLIKANTVQLQQTISNILLNAIQAIEKVGIIKIQTMFTSYLNQQKEKTNAVQITISNNGPKIPKEHLSYIFNPFFTSKSTGSGLGLSIVKESIETTLGGKINISSNKNWTSFTIFIPTKLI